MEQKVKLITTTKFQLAEEEIHRLYSALALLQYPYECDPNYCNEHIIRRLRNDFNRFNNEMQTVCENNPNNLVLSQIRNFIQRHYGYLKRVTKE